MKSLFSNILIVIVLLLILPSCGQQKRANVIVPQKSDSLQKKGPGKIVFDKEIHNFGTVKDGEIVSFSFVFRNEGGEPFKIVKTQKSCGCIDIKYNSEPITSGETSAIEVIVNTAGEWGNLIKSVEIETSQGEKKELQIGAYIENKQFNNQLNTQK
jgi:hypothetical protein